MSVLVCVVREWRRPQHGGRAELISCRVGMSLAGREEGGRPLWHLCCDPGSAVHVSQRPAATAIQLSGQLNVAGAEPEASRGPLWTSHPSCRPLTGAPKGDVQAETYRRMDR